MPVLDPPVAPPVVSGFNRVVIQQKLIDSLGENIKSNPLRKEYERKVAELSSYAERIQPNMTQDELRNLATEANQARRQLGLEYKDLTPGPLKEFIYEFVLDRYGDALGPTGDYLIKNGRSYTDIIKSAVRPNPDVDTLLGNFGEWLSKQPASYLQRYQGSVGRG
ncbi:hypothetical protein [Pseudomonas sp. A34-9]|uniref:hypothetical protein n=1 Tax=Pseudomonas sp. A34-9 TaxID=3034675 RepID=UPI00240D5D9F|nr:hypothetical protein [Pseudomonas sp. A34-9]